MTTDKKYPNGTVYKIWSHINDSFYIGSTFMPLRCRKYSHKHNKVEKMKQWFDDVGWDNLKFEEIATYKDITKQELNKYEDEEILKHKGDENCMNTKRAYRPKLEYMKEYNQQNKEKKREHYKENRHKYIEYAKEYRHKYRERCKQYAKDYQKRHYIKNPPSKWGKDASHKSIFCQFCNETHTAYNYDNHLKTIKHMSNFINY